jgi:hypothetical protein
VPELLALRKAETGAPFVIGPSFRLSFGQADAESRELAGRLLAKGIGKGTRVALLSTGRLDPAQKRRRTRRRGVLSGKARCRRRNLVHWSDVSRLQLKPPGR